MATKTISQNYQQAVSEPLQQHRAIVLLTQGHSNMFVGKTAISLLKYRSQDVTAILDNQTDATSAQQLFGSGGEIPVVGTLDRAPHADALYIGIAPPGGNLPESWKPIILQAIERGWDIVSGLHDFLCRDDDYVAAASSSGARLIDVRRNHFNSIATGQPFCESCLRIHAVGHDCSVGKMVVCLELDRGLRAAGLDSHFLATGQTGIMIGGDGLPIDCIVADFVNGAAEQLVRQHDQHDFLVIEGQGSISHPAYSAVTLGLLHGCAPHGLVFCYEAGRDQVKGLDNIAIPPLEKQIEACLVNANLRHPCQIIGVAVNSRKLTSEQADEEIERMEQELGLPACDVYRHGPQKLVQACVRLKQNRIG